MVNIVAELAVDVDGLSAVYDVLQFLFAEADERPGDAFAAAIAAAKNSQLNLPKKRCFFGKKVAPRLRA